MKKQNGFTLIELIIVISIAMIVLAISVGSYRDSIARVKLRSSADGLVADIKYAQQLAITNPNEAQFCRIRFPDNKSYVIEDSTGKVFKTVDFPRVVSISSGPSQIIFLINGTPQINTDIQITLVENRHNKNRIITVKKITGEVVQSSTTH